VPARKEAVATIPPQTGAALSSGTSHNIIFSLPAAKIVLQGDLDDQMPGNADQARIAAHCFPLRLRLLTVAHHSDL
jgi:hypothetical protein